MERHNTSGLSGDALKKAQQYNDALKKAEKSLDKQQKIAEKLSSTLLGVSGGEFFRNLSNDEYAQKMSEIDDKILESKKKATQLGQELNSSFEEIGKSIGISSSGVDELSARLGISQESIKSIKENFDATGNFIGDSVQLMNSLGAEADILLDYVGKEGISQSFLDSHEALETVNLDIKESNIQVGKLKDSVLDLEQGFSAVGKNISRNLLKNIIEFDSTIKKSQLETGINFTENSSSMALLTSETARFGMSVGDTAQMMGDLGKELRTTNFNVLSEAAEDLAAMQKSTGLASADIAKLTKEFVMFGKNSKDVANFSAEVMRDAYAYGVNGKEIMQDMANNMSKMRNMGFTGGEQSLKRMSLEAKRLGMSVDEIFDTAKRARNIEGAMNMAAELQLAGGSFASIDPMQLLSAARKGPEELQKILGKMGNDIGNFNEETNKYEFDPVDTDRLQIVADATGQSIDSLQNMISKNFEDNKKINLLPSTMFGAELTDEEKAFIMNATKIGENGALELDAKLEGIDDLSDLNGQSLKGAMEAAKKEKESLEEQAKQNMSFNESKEALMASFTNLFSVFEPVIQIFTNLLNGINSMGQVAKTAFAVGVGAFALLFGPVKSFAQGMSMSKGFMAGMKGGGLFSGLKDSIKGGFDKAKGIFGKIFSKTSTKGIEQATGKSGDFINKIKDTEQKGGEIGKASSKSGSGLKGLANGLKEMGDAKVFKGIAAMALAGPSMIMFLPAIPSLLLFSLVGLVSKPLEQAFNAISKGYGIMGKNLVNIAKGSLAMALVGASFLPFALSAKMMSDVDWLNVLAGVGVATLVVGGLTLLGMGMSVALPFLLLGAGGLVIAGSALLVGAMLMGKAGDFLSILMAPLQSIASTDWSGLIGFGDALLSVSSAFITFGIAGLAMFNPLTLLGLATMLGSMSILNSLMVTLAPNLQQGANGIERMAEGVAKLESAVSKLNTEKLEKLKQIMSEGGKGMGEFMAAVNQGGSGGGKDSKVTHVVELNLDGKKIQEIILRDTKHLK